MSENIQDIQEYKKEKLWKAIRKAGGEKAYRYALKHEDIRDLEFMKHEVENHLWEWEMMEELFWEELDREAERILAEVETDPDSKNWKPPADLYDKVMQRIRESENAKN